MITKLIKICKSFFRTPFHINGFRGTYRLDTADDVSNLVKSITAEYKNKTHDLLDHSFTVYHVYDTNIHYYLLVPSWKTLTENSV